MNKLSFSLLACALVACGGSSSTGNDPTGGGSSSSGGSTSSSGGSGSSDAPPPTSTSTSPTLPADASPCVTATHALCAKACACTANGKCVIAYGNGVATEEHESITDCDNFYALYVCGQPEQAKVYGDAACSSALGSAACIATKSKGNALDFPVACKAPTK